MTRNVFPLHPSDKKMIEGPVDYVDLRGARHVVIRAMPPAEARAGRAPPRAAARLGHAATIAIAFLRFNAIALTLGFTTGVLAVLVPALVIGWVVS